MIFILSIIEVLIRLAIAIGLSVFVLFWTFVFAERFRIFLLKESWKIKK